MGSYQNRRRGKGTAITGASSSTLRHAYNAGRFSYYNAAYPFINVTKNFSGYWGPGVTSLGATGWPTNLANGSRAYCDFVFDMDANFGYFPPGAYVVKTTANVDVSITDIGDNASPFGVSGISNAHGQASFTAADVGAGNWNSFSIRISLRNNSGAPININDLYCCLQSEEASLIGGEIFKADYCALHAGARTIRFLDWLGVNAGAADLYRHFSQLKNDETKPSYTSQLNVAIAPVSICMKFAKKIGAEPQFAVPAGYANFWFGKTASTNRITCYDVDQVTIIPHMLSEGEAVAIDYFTTLVAGLAPLNRLTVYYAKNVTTLDFQLSATLGGSPITLTGGTTMGPQETSFATIGTVEPDQYNDMFLPFMAACFAADPNATMHVTWTNEFWNSTYRQFGLTRTQASIQATGGASSGSTFQFASAAAYNLLRVWKAAEVYYPASKVHIHFDNQAANPTNPWSGVFDYVDVAGIYGTAGQTISQIFGARLSRAHYSIAPYAYPDFNIGDYNAAGVQPDFVYSSNGNSFVIPDSYWDGLFANGLQEAINQTAASVAFAQSKVPGIQCSTYEWGIAYSTNFFANTHTGGVLTIQSLKTYLDGAKGTGFYTSMFNGTVGTYNLYAATQLLGPQGWRATESIFDVFGIRDATPSHTSGRWSYFQTV